MAGPKLKSLADVQAGIRSPEKDNPFEFLVRQALADAGETAKNFDNNEEVQFPLVVKRGEVFLRSVEDGVISVIDNKVGVTGSDAMPKVSLQDSIEEEDIDGAVKSILGTVRLNALEAVRTPIFVVNETVLSDETDGQGVVVSLGRLEQLPKDEEERVRSVKALDCLNGAGSEVSDEVAKKSTHVLWRREDADENGPLGVEFLNARIPGEMSVLKIDLGKGGVTLKAIVDTIHGQVCEWGEKVDRVLDGEDEEASQE